jgi:accessory colonization factor AcfC
VRKGNPRGLRGIADLARPDVRLFFSNPVSEKVSFDAYFETVKQVAARARVTLDFVDERGALRPVPRLVFGEVIHHREAPLAVAGGSADVAVVFHHLGLRCVRAFPDRFATVALGDESEHVKSETHIALVGDGGEFGAAFVAFMHGREAARIYERHGLDPLGQA